MSSFNEFHDRGENRDNQFPGILRKVLIAITAIIGLTFMYKMFVYNTSGQIMVLQRFWSGKMQLNATPGLVVRALGDIQKIKKETSVKFTDNKNEPGIVTPAVFVRHNDGGTAKWGGVARFRYPQNEKIYDVLRVFGNEKNVMKELFIPGVREICTSTAGLLSTEESYTTKRSMISVWCSDQAMNGVYFSDITYEDMIDEFGQERTIPVYNIRERKPGVYDGKTPIFGQFGIECNMFKVTEISYLGNIDQQIQKKMGYKTQLQVVNSEILKLEQKLNEAEATGQRKVTEARMTELKTKEKIVQEKEGWKRIELTNVRADSIKVVNDLKAVIYESSAEIKEAEGKAEKRRKVMQGDNALNLRLEAYNEIMTAWYDAVAQRSENAPEMSGNNWDPNYFVKLLNEIDARVRKELGINFKF
jgi:hypothetical protein